MNDDLKPDFADDIPGDGNMGPSLPAVDGNAKSLAPALAHIQTSRLHWTSLLFDVISHSRNYLIPAAVALFSAARGNHWGIIFAGFFFFPSLLFSVVKYFTLRYGVEGRNLVVQQGLIFRSVRTIPVSRVQNIDLVQNILHRLFKVAEVRIETASGTDPEAILRVLTLDQVEQLRSEIFELKVEPGEAPTSDHRFGFGSDEDVGYQGPSAEPGMPSSPFPAYAHHASSTRPARIPLVQIPLSWLVRAGLASNRGMIMVGIAVGLLYQFDLLERIDFGPIRRFMNISFDNFWVFAYAAVAIVVLSVLLRILSVVWYILRFYQFQLASRGDDLQISCGLLTRVSATVPRARIQAISIHQNMMLRWMGFSTVRIETAGGSASAEDASQTVSRHWFLPILPDDRLPGILNHLRPGMTFEPEMLDWKKVAAKAIRRRVKLPVVTAVVLAAIAAYFLPPWGGLAGVVLLPLLVTLKVLEIRSIRYARWDQGLVHQSGFFERKTTLTFFERIQSVAVQQSPFDRRWGMATLSIDTAGAGPADHDFSIPLLDSSFAINEQNHLQALAAEHLPQFG